MTTNTPRTIVITGNHHTPALELIRQIRRYHPHWRLDYIAQATPNETHLRLAVRRLPGLNYHPISSGKFNRRYLPETLLGIPLIIKAFHNSRKILKTIRPDLIVSFGGYTSVPVIIAARSLAIPSITHEQTISLSLSTRINSLFVNKVALSFPESVKSNPSHLLLKNKFIITGNLLRRQIYSTRSSLFSRIPGLLRRPIIFVTGGNQGSLHINRTLESILPRLCRRYNIIHHTGPLDYPRYRRFSRIYPGRYLPYEYISGRDIGWVLNHCRLIINRAGANYCQEIVALGKDAILIPLPASAAGEQLKNSHYVRDRLPRTKIITDELLTPNNLLSAINSFPNNRKSLSHPPKFQENLSLLKLINEII